MLNLKCLKFLKRSKSESNTDLKKPIAVNKTTYPKKPTKDYNEWGSYIHESVVINKYKTKY